jgi:Zn-finger nucleic acid-binding protein
VADLIRCEHCGRQVNPRSAYCPFCGGRVIAPPSVSEARCPRCGVALEAAKGEASEIELCPQCGGMWLDRGEFRLATAEANVYRDFELKDEYQRPAVREDFRYLPCVRCGKQMVRENFRRISGVIIDRCVHGVWLDAGELEKIRHFIADGGLDRSQDREIEGNRQALEELARTAKDTAFTVRMIHFFNPKRWFFSGW